MRIAVGRFADSVTVDVKGKKTTVARSKDGLLVDGKAISKDVYTITGPLLSLSGHSYREALEVRAVTYKGKRELLVVHPLDLETYVTGIVSSELPKGWPLAAYQAQAVAARTFAMMQKYRRLDLPYHMESTVLDQVYHGVEREHALASEAAQTTKGQVLTHERRLAQTYFHAACGGTTESAAEGWGTALPYLPGSSCGKCLTAGTNRASWSVRVKKADVDRVFKPLIASVDDVRIVSRTASSRVKKVELTSRQGKKTAKKVITGADFRRLIGWGVVWSTQIDSIAFDKKSGDLVVNGRGSGHGVGMCQWGAKGFADAGTSYDVILGRYYPGAAIMRLY